MRMINKVEREGVVGGGGEQRHSNCMASDNTC